MSKVIELPFGQPAIDEVKRLLVLQSSEGQPPSLFDVYLDAVLLLSRSADPWQLDDLADHIGIGTKQVKILVYQPGATKAIHATKYLLHCNGQGQNAAKNLSSILHQSGQAMEKLLEGRGAMYRQLGECQNQVLDLKQQLTRTEHDKEKLGRLLDQAMEEVARLEEKNKAIRENPWGSFNWGESLSRALAGSLSEAAGINTPPVNGTFKQEPAPAEPKTEKPDTVQPLDGAEAELPEQAQPVQTTVNNGLGLNMEAEARQYFNMVAELHQRLPEPYRQVFWDSCRYLKGDPALLWEVWEIIRSRKGVKSQKNMIFNDLGGKFFPSPV